MPNNPIMRKGPRSRRKNATPVKGNQAPPPEESAGNVEMTEKEQKPIVTENEAALAAKNYRLARELSELRQKAKEEAKAVTNLTMQNMNLASRCRQALNHVESLRKELARYQKQGQGHSSSTPTSTSMPTSPPNEIVPVPIKDERRGVPVSSHYANEVAPRRDENRIFGRTLKSPNSSNVPQDNFERNTNMNNKNSSDSTIMTNTDGNGNDGISSGVGAKVVQSIQEESTGSKLVLDKPYILSQEMEGHDLDVNMNMNLSENVKQKISSTPKTPSPVTPETDEETPSPPLSNDAEQEFGDAETNITFGELRSEDFFHQTYESTLPATPEKENIDVESMNRQFDSFNISEGDGKQGKGNKGSNEKEGDKGSFDAFEASFKTTFPSSFTESVSPSNFGGTEFSDSFFLEGASSNSGKNKIKSPKKGEDDLDPAADAPIDEALELFPNPALTTTFEPFETPPKPSSNEVSPKNPSSSPSSGSSRSNSNGGLSARARFERRQRKVIESSPPNAPMDEAQADEAGEHSPTLVLKRLKQRQAKANSNIASPSVVSAKSISISEEIRKLDAIATSISTAGREKQRRSVSRPTSYAEPSLSSKLRRGDVFFPKENSSSLSNSKSNPNNEEVGKDLTQATRVPSSPVA